MLPEHKILPGLTNTENEEAAQAAVRVGTQSIRDA